MILGGAVCLPIAVLVCLASANAATIENTYDPNPDVVIPAGSSAAYYVSISGAPPGAVITNVEAKFDYIAYGEVHNYVSVRFNRGSDPGSFGGVSMVSQGSLPPGNPGTYGFVSFPNWNGQSVDANYFFRFSTGSGSPYDPTIKSMTVRVTYSVTPPTPTSPPDGSVYSNPPSGLTLQWSSVPGAVEYEVYIDNNSGFGSPERIVTISSTSWPYSGSLPNNLYYWQVRAMNGSGQWGPFSSSRRFVLDTPPPAPALQGPPSSTQVSQGSSVQFSWSGPSGYAIERYYLRIVPGTNLNAAPVYDEELSGTSRNVQANWPSGTYTWSVRAIKTAPPGINKASYEAAVGWGAYATPHRTLVVSAPPAAPTPTSPADGSVYRNPPTGLTLAWSSVPGAVEYEIYIDNNSGFGSPELVTTTGATSWPYSGSLPDNLYHWQVHARNGSGQWGDFSSPRKFVLDTPPPTPTLQAPPPSAQFASGDSIPFSWSGPGGYDIDRYYLRAVPGTDLNAAPVFDEELAGTSRSVAASWAPGTYTWGVRAIKSPPPGIDQAAYESAIGWGDYATRQLEILPDPFDLSVTVDGLPPSNTQRGSSIDVTCTVTRTGGSLPTSGEFVRVYLYLGQDPNDIAGSTQIAGDAEQFDFARADLDDGSETLQTTVTIPTTLEGPFYVQAVVDGPDFWAESDEGNNLAASGSTVAIWRPGTPLPDETDGVLARTWDDQNGTVYWIKYGKRWPIIDQPTFFGLGYADADVEWYGSGALSGFPFGKTVLLDNDDFVYRNQTESTVYIIRDGVSDWFVDWDVYLASGFVAEDLYWTTTSGFSWIQSAYPPGEEIGAEPRIRLDPNRLDFD